MANLTQVARIIKSEVVLITFGVLSLAILALAIFGFLTRDKTPPPPAGIPWQNDIYPGATTKEQLESSLGPPQEVAKTNGKLTYLYPSNSEARPHAVDITGNIVQIVKEQISTDEKGKLDNYMQKYGAPQRKIYGEHGTFAPGHFWAEVGLLIFANQFDGTIVEIWYFPPKMSAEELVAQNSNLSLEEPKHF